MDSKEQNEFIKRLAEEYRLSVPGDVVASIYCSKPKVRPLFSRASFRSGGTVRSSERVRAQEHRRHFLRNILGLAVVTLPALFWLKTAYFSPPVETPSYVTDTAIQSNAPVSGGRLLINSASVPVGQSMMFNDPSLGQFYLIHLTNGQFVAYSTICTHAGCQVQFDPSSMDLICPCHGAVYDPSNGAQVLAGPAPFPLRNIPVQYDASTGNVYLMA
jgi:thiosulfate dehydrogenase [quinone] large subunit